MEEIYASQHWAPPNNPGPFILETRQNAVGSGTPPYNNGLPPVNIAFIYACYTGEDNAMAIGFLWPYYFYNATNQAELGWPLIFLRETRANRTSNAFWGALKDGLTAVEARQEAVDEYLGYHEEHPEYYLRCWGDFHARLNGVYTGSSYLPPTFWYDY
jgi:hypothetical protein